jgi:cell division protein FtsL
MATAERAIASPRRAGALHGAPARRARQPSRRPRLDVVAERNVRDRTRRRQALMLRGLGVALVVGALAASAAAHAYVASQQQAVDMRQIEVAHALLEQQTLQVERAQLEAPSRVLYIAERRLGMVLPPTVTYLPPINPGPSVSQFQHLVAAQAVASAAAKASKQTKPTP